MNTSRKHASILTLSAVVAKTGLGLCLLGLGQMVVAAPPPPSDITTSHIPVRPAPMAPTGGAAKIAQPKYPAPTARPPLPPSSVIKWAPKRP